MQADQAIARGLSCLGAPFRLHGRCPKGGLDCVGLIAFAYARTGGVPDGYALRNAEGARWEQLLDQHFVRQSDHQPRRGDILLLDAGPNQFHLGLWDGAGLIHADSRTRRVIRTPGPVAWPILGLWSDQ